jgi:hypothetical protein
MRIANKSWPDNQAVGHRGLLSYHIMLRSALICITDENGDIIDRCSLRFRKVSLYLSLFVSPSLRELGQDHQILVRCTLRSTSRS